MLTPMKHLIFLFFIFTISCKAQIIPVENRTDYDGEHEFAEGTYFKDVNGLISEFYGHWKSVNAPDGKQIDLYISPYTYTDMLGVQFDSVVLRYTLKDSLGSVIFSTVNLPQDSPYVSDGGYFINNKRTFSVFYQGEQSECGQNGQLHFAIKVNMNRNFMGFSYSVHDDRFGLNCPDNVEQVMPFGVSIVMVRQ